MGMKGERGRGADELHYTAKILPINVIVLKSEQFPTINAQSQILAFFREFIGIFKKLVLPIPFGIIGSSNE